MAIFPVTYIMVDAYQRPVRKTFEVNAADQPAAKTVAAAVAADLAAITGARILAYQVMERVVYTDVVDAGANRDAGLTLSVRTADNEKATITVPAPIAGLFNADGSVDLADGGLSAFMANFLSGDVRVDDGEVVSELISGHLDK